MNSRNSLLMKAGVVLVVLWVAVWGIMKITGAMRPSPEKVAAFVDENPLSEITDSAARKEKIGKLAKMLNELDPNEISKLMEDRRRGDEAMDREDLFFSQMTEEEQWYFMEMRVGRAFDQMMQAFNQMEDDERKQIVQRTLREMDRRGDGDPARGRLADRDTEMVDKIVNEGLRSYYQKASVETKMDLAPLMEEMQRNVGLSGRMKGRQSEK